MTRTKIDWNAVREQYVTGTESYADIARRLTISPTAVEKHALNRRANGGQTWGELRTAFRDTRDEAAREETLETQAELQASISVNRLKVADMCIKRILELGTDGAKRRELAEVAKVGLDQKIHVATEKPVEVDLGISATERTALRRLLEEAGGRPAQ